jgi:hypothetical protein
MISVRRTWSQQAQQARQQEELDAHQLGAVPSSVSGVLEPVANAAASVQPPPPENPGVSADGARSSPATPSSGTASALEGVLKYFVLVCTGTVL